MYIIVYIHIYIYTYICIMCVYICIYIYTIIPIIRSHAYNPPCLEDLGMMNWRFPEIEVPPNHPFVYGVFHYRPSIFGYFHVWKSPIATRSLIFSWAPCPCEQDQSRLTRLSRLLVLTRSSAAATAWQATKDIGMAGDPKFEKVIYGGFLSHGGTPKFSSICRWDFT